MRIICFALVALILGVTIAADVTVAKHGFDHCADLPSIEVGTSCWMTASSINPTQAVIGTFEVEVKVDMLSKMDKDHVESYLVDHVRCHLEHTFERSRLRIYLCLLCDLSFSRTSS